MPVEDGHSWPSCLRFSAKTRRAGVPILQTNCSQDTGPKLLVGPQEAFDERHLVSLIIKRHFVHGKHASASPQRPQGRIQILQRPLLSGRMDWSKPGPSSWIVYVAVSGVSRTSI